MNTIFLLHLMKKNKFEREMKMMKKILKIGNKKKYYFY